MGAARRNRPAALEEPPGANSANADVAKAEINALQYADIQRRIRATGGRQGAQLTRGGTSLLGI